MLDRSDFRLQFIQIYYWNKLRQNYFVIMYNGKFYFFISNVSKTETQKYVLVI